MNQTAPFSQDRASLSWHLHPKRIIRLFFTYRLVLALALGLFALTDWGPDFLGSVDPFVHRIVVLAYIALTATSLGLSFTPLLSTEVEYLFALFVDSVCIAFIIHTSGGPQSGLGILLGISIAFGTQGMPARATILAAIFATLAILIETYIADLADFRPHTTYTMVAMLGVSYFALAILSYELSHRTRFSEKMMRQQGQDILDLTRINEQVIQHMQTGVLILDQHNHIKMANDAAWRLIGCAQGCFGQPLEVVNANLAKILEDWKKNPRAYPQWLEQTDNKDLLLRFQFLDESGQSGILIFLDDATEAAETAQQLKLASLGRLVASIAHEIRNPLGAIGHASQLLQESSSLEAADKHLTDIIERNTARVNEVIENILTLSRHNTAHPQQVELLPWLEKLRTELLENHKLDSAQLQLSVEPKSTQALFDPKQIGQAINALVENAVKHAQRPLHQIQIHLRAGLSPNHHNAFIEICDNGERIADDIVEKIFEPFFTTSHRGTGLGLYVVKALCDANGIRIHYQHSNDYGNCFYLHIPDKIRFIQPH